MLVKDVKVKPKIVLQGSILFMKLRQPFWTIVRGGQKESNRIAFTIMGWKDSIATAISYSGILVTPIDDS